MGVETTSSRKIQVLSRVDSGGAVEVLKPNFTEQRFAPKELFSLKGALDRKDPRIRRRGRGGSCRRMPHNGGSCPMGRSDSQCRVLSYKRLNTTSQGNRGSRRRRDNISSFSAFKEKLGIGLKDKDNQRVA